MRQMMAIASREFVERKLVLTAGAVLAVLILFTPMLPGSAGFSKGDVIGTAAAWVSAMILMVGSLIMGMTGINGDLGERRLGFYFSRPMSGLAIWLGKILGLLAVVAATAFITLLPAAPFGFRPLLELETVGVTAFFGTALGLFFFGHVVACMARVRSVWLLLDVAGLFVVATSAYVLFHFYFRLLPIDYVGQFMAVATGRSLAVALAFAAAAGCIGLLVGRVEASRVHRWTAISLWSMALVAIAIVSSVSVWVAGSRPRDVPSDARRVIHDGGAGGWLNVTGPARAGLYQEYLVLSDGRFLRLGSRFGVAGTATRIVAVEPEPIYRFNPGRSRQHGTVVTAELGEDVSWRPTKIEVDGLQIWGTQPALSPSGRLLVLPTETGIVVYSLPDETLVRSMAIDLTGAFALLRFVDDDHLRVFKREFKSRPSEPDHIEVITVDIPRGHHESTASFDADGYSLDPTAKYVLAKSGKERAIVNVESGDVVGKFEARTNVFTTRWLSNGLLAIPDRTDGGRVLRLMERTGSEVKRVEFPGDDMLRPGFEPSQNMFAATVARTSDTEHCRERRLIAVDLATGETREVAKGLTTLWSWSDQVPPGSFGTRTFIDCDGRVIRYDATLENPETLLD